MSNSEQQGSFTVTGSLPARIAAIEARQREYGMHDPACPARLVERMNQNGGGPHYVAQPCTCWLSTEPSR